MLRLRWFLIGVIVGAFFAVRWMTRQASLITPPAFAPLLRSPLRLAYRRPEDMAAFAGIQPGWRALDLGCGNGAYTLALAQRAARVDAVDVQPAMIAALRKQMRSAGVANVFPHVAPATHLPFGDATFDAALMISVLPMLHNRDAALVEARRVLKPGGVLVIGEDLLEPEYVREATTRRWVERASFQLLGRDATPLRYSLKFVKAAKPDEPPLGLTQCSPAACASTSEA